MEFFTDDETFRSFDSFYKGLMERMFREMQDFEKAISSGKLKGDWEFKPIRKPGVAGYVARGHFQLGGSPISSVKRATEERRDPLTDVFDEKENVKLYIELPGVEKDDIQLDITERFAEVKAKNFSKTVQLPAAGIDVEKVKASYKNGVLEVTIPKTAVASEDEKKRTIQIG